MLILICGVTHRDKIRNENIRGTARLVQASKKITEKLRKWYSHHTVRRMLDVDIGPTRGKKKREAKHKVEIYGV